MKEELVSIIVPVYNANKFLQDTVNTIKEQTYKNWEVIFVNDCSTDNSKEIIEEQIKNDKRIRLINLKTNSGAAVARNTGIDEAKGRYIAFLDADDLWKKEKLEKQIKFMQENDYAFTFTSYEFLKEDKTRTGKIASVPKKLVYNEGLKNTTIFTSTVILDTSKLGKEIIKMPLVKSEDTATWWKILKEENTAYGLCEVLTYYRRGSNTLSSNKLIAIKRIWNLYRNVENLSLLYSVYCFIFYAINAVKRRV